MRKSFNLHSPLYSSQDFENPAKQVEISLFFVWFCGEMGREICGIWRQQLPWYSLYSIFNNVIAAQRRPIRQIDGHFSCRFIFPGPQSMRRLWRTENGFIDERWRGAGLADDSGPALSPGTLCHRRAERRFLIAPTSFMAHWRRTIRNWK